MIQIEREWIAVDRSERIRGKGATAEQARRAAQHLGHDYHEVVAIPKNTPGFI